jgi:hypothetical protein
MATSQPDKAAPGLHRTDQRAIRIISHSMLFYWWPVWAAGFLLAFWTALTGDRLVIVPLGTEVKDVREIQANNRRSVELTVDVPEPLTPQLAQAIEAKKHNDATNQRDVVFRMHMSHMAWMGPVFFTVLILVIISTNVPLRGLWSVIAILIVVILVIVLSLFDVWDRIFTAVASLHIYVNMAGYLFIASGLFIIWVASVFYFDQLTYMVFTPGQLKVCQEIGGGEVAYDTMGMTVEKHRNDLFRHWILGLGSGDLTVRTAGAQAHVFSMPNVLFVGRKLYQIEEMQRERPTVQG